MFMGDLKTMINRTTKIYIYKKSKGEFKATLMCKSVGGKRKRVLNTRNLCKVKVYL